MAALPEAKKTDEGRIADGYAADLDVAASAFRSIMADDHSGMSMGLTLALVEGLAAAKEKDPEGWAERRKAEERAAAKGDWMLEEYACACVDSAARAYKAMLGAEKPVSDKAMALLRALAEGRASLADAPLPDAPLPRPHRAAPSILKVIDRFANRESTTGFIEDYKRYIKGDEMFHAALAANRQGEKA